MAATTNHDSGLSARDVARSDAVKRVARVGLAARATLYLLISWLALLIARGDRRHEADQRGALEEVTRHQGGYVLLGIMAFGFAAYALWRFSEFGFGTVGEGRKWGPRLKSLVRGVVYGSFAVVAVQVLLHTNRNSQARQQQQVAAKLMDKPLGRIAVGIAGVIVLGVGLMMVVEGVRRKFKKYFDFAAMSRRVRTLVWVLGTTGTIARGLVFSITGVFVIRAAQEYDSRKSRGLDFALKSVANATHGQLLLTLLALGLLSFAAFGYAEAVWRRT